MEQLVLKILKFDLGCVTILNFLDRYLKAADGDVVFDTLCKVMRAVNMDHVGGEDGRLPWSWRERSESRLQPNSTGFSLIFLSFFLLDGVVPCRVDASRW